MKKKRKETINIAYLLVKTSGFTVVTLGTEAKGSRRISIIPEKGFNINFFFNFPAIIRYRLLINLCLAC